LEFRVVGTLTWIARPPATREEFGLLLSSADFEISAAAAVYPNAIPANAPGAPLDAWRITTFANQSYSGADTLAAPMAFHVTRLAVNGLNVTAAITVAIASLAVLARRAGRHQSQEECQSKHGNYQSQFHFSSIK
jgi:hypothetical protein